MSADAVVTPAKTSRPVLIGCAHGTREPAGQQVILDLLEAIRGHLGVDVREAYVDVQDPKVDQVVDSIPAAGEGSGPTAVVVPLLLAGGYHVYVDIAKATQERDDVVAAPALGPDERLIDIVLERVAEAGIPDTATLVLAAAGSSDPRSQADTEAAADMLRTHWGGPVRIGYAAGIKPSVAEAVEAARANGEEMEVAVASFLLSPGFFQGRIEAAGADHFTAPLAPHPLLLDIVADRYRDASGA
ncbi:sirohydrochlorin chelatase [Demequina aurantiaca]|uniref:sirohydrochlorin chelatase n=1 Tax=Demequina aurantiaca TaxID=676200 RepID=UPI001F3860EE|nr:sirohydrochlorin chelatase [Demequina aurantiaca]